MQDLDTKNGNAKSVELAVRVTNPDRLMYGEDPKTQAIEDTVHWIKAYTELLEFKDRLLLDMESGIKSLSEPSSREIRELDLTLIEIQRTRYRSRLVFWKDHKAKLLAKKTGSS